MNNRAARLPKPDPDFNRFLSTVRREQTDWATLIELAIHPKVVAALLDEPLSADRLTNVRRSVRLQHRLGYDVVRTSALIPWGLPRLTATTASGSDSSHRAWADQHAGPIGCMADFERFPWPEQNTIDWAPVDTAREVLPDGMAMIGFCGGVFEFAMDLLGMERFMIAMLRDPDLVAATLERVGGTVLGVLETYCCMDDVCAIWLGDDLGYKHGTFVSPAWICEHLVPWYERFARLAHEHDRPLLFHTCGQTQDVMPALVEQVGIDAKHSFEDVIQPVEEFYDRWHDKIGVLGGIDVDLLSRGSERDVRRRMRSILEHAAPRGGYAAGSGNSITDYVSPGNYLAMIETVMEFSGRL